MPLRGAVKHAYQVVECGRSPLVAVQCCRLASDAEEFRRRPAPVVARSQWPLAVDRRAAPRYTG